MADGDPGTVTDDVSDGVDLGPVTAARLADLERRVLALESAAGATATPRSGPASPVGDPVGTGGTVSYSGDVTLAGEVVWSIELTAGAVLQLPDSATTTVLAGLGHPARAAMVRRLLRGPAAVADLQEAVGSTSTGQLYHHLRTLTGCGLVEVDGRGSYRVPVTAVVPALTLLLAAADVAGQLGTVPSTVVGAV